MTLEEAKRKIEEAYNWAIEAKKTTNLIGMQDFQSGKAVAFAVCLKILKDVENCNDA